MSWVRALRRHPATSRVAWLLTVALLAAIPGGPTRRAWAQGGEQTARTAAVLDFANLVERSPLMGRDVSSSVALSLTQQGFTVTPRAIVLDALAKLGLHPPYEADNIRAIAKELDVQKIYGGAVLAMLDQPGARPRQLVDVKVEEYDGPTGDMINGGYGKGVEEIKGGGDTERDAARAAAIDRAVAKSFEAMHARTLITGAVMSYKPEGGKVMINRGLKQGVQEGMLFDVFRAKLDDADPLKTISVKVGRIKVSGISSDDAECTIVFQTQGVNQRDQLREVFQLPKYVVTNDGVVPEKIQPTDTGGLRRLMAPLIGIGLGAAVLGGLAMMLTHTVRDAPSVVASNAYLSQSGDGNNPSIVFQWGDRNFAPPPAYIGGYVVYRGNTPGVSSDEGAAVGATVGSNGRAFYDNNEWTNKTYPITVRYQDSAGSPQTPTTTLTIIHLSPQPGQQYYYRVARLGPPMPTTPPTLISRGRGAGATRSAMTSGGSRRVLRSRGNVQLSPWLFGAPLRTGRQVTVLNPPAAWNNTLDPATDNVVNPPATIGLSDASNAAGPVHYIVPPVLAEPASGNQAMPTDNITFKFEGELGATEYRLQIATDALFTNKWFEGQLLTTVTGPLNLKFDDTQPNYRALRALTTYYWRIGARCSGEPAPQPGGYVWSNHFTFTTADQAPAPPRNR